MKPILSANNLCLKYESNSDNKIQALSDISFNIYDNEFICIVGSNGSGKTSLLRLISKDIIPTSGELFFRDTNLCSINDNHWRLYLGMIHQNPSDGLALDLSAHENLLLSHLKGKDLSPLRSVYTKKTKVALNEALNKSQINHEFNLNQKVKELSGGEKQLLALMMINLQSPGILMLDEPTSSLDPQNCHKVIDLLFQWSAKKLFTIIMVTHQLEIAFSLSQFDSRILVLNEGQITNELKSKELANMTPDIFKSTFYT